MKKILLSYISLLCLCGSALVKAQSFSVQSDTIFATAVTTAVIHNDITNNTSSPLSLHWSVVSTNFPADWLTPVAFGVCDNNLCRNNNGDTLLWKTASGVTGTSFVSSPYAPGVAGLFDISMNLTGASSGSHYVTINISNPLVDSKNITFVVNKFPTAVSNVNAAEPGVTLYPNPATSELNVVYNANADIKTIAVYNIIGKMMTVYKVNGTSANLDLSNIPSGIYFVRLTNSRGDVVVTRKFTKQ